MKKNLLLGLITLLSVSTKAQQTQGKVIYEQNIQLQLNIAGMDEAMQHMLPKRRTTKFELLFGNNQSLWKQLEDEMPEENINGGLRVMMNVGNERIIYHNFNEGKRIEQQEVGVKKYIIEDTVQKFTWKLTDETKTILGHVCRKATTQRMATRMSMSMSNGKIEPQEIKDTNHITAWFTTDIAVPAGPVFQGQLPGLILEINMNNGQNVYKAMEISEKVDLTDIKAPSKGKKLSQQEFDKEMQKMMEEMQKNRRGTGGFFKSQ